MNVRTLVVVMLTLLLFTVLSGCVQDEATGPAADVSTGSPIDDKAAPSDGQEWIRSSSEVRMAGSYRIVDPVLGAGRETGTSFEYSPGENQLVLGINLSLEWSAEPTGGFILRVTDTDTREIAVGTSPLEVPTIWLNNSSGEGNKLRLLIWLGDKSVEAVWDMMITVEVNALIARDGWRA